MKKQLDQIGFAKVGVSMSWTLDGVEIMFTAPDMESLQWFLGVLDEKFEPTKCRETVLFPADAVLNRLKEKIMEKLPVKGSA
jgi:hypothetical protein